MAKAYLDNDDIKELKGLSASNRARALQYFKEIISLYHKLPRSKWNRGQAISYTLHKKRLNFLSRLKEGFSDKR